MGRTSYKAVGDKILPNFINNTKVIIYDDKNIQYIVGNGASFEWEPQYRCLESMDGTRTPIDMRVAVTLGLSDAECLDNIKLDKTLMERIAVFNKEQQCKKLDKEIKEKKERIKEIEAILEDREHRLDKLKEFIADIYDIDIENNDWDD